MKRTNALQTMLEDMTAIYHNHGHRLNVEFDDQPHAKNATTVAVSSNVRQAYGRNLDPANELRVIVDTLSHEVEHVNESDLSAKERFMSFYPECPALAGLVINVLEDVYIDQTRTARYPGLKRARAFAIDAIMQNHQRRPRIDNLDRTNAAAEGFLQVALAGYAKGINDADPEVRELLAQLRWRARLIVEFDDPDDRYDIAHDVMGLFLEFIGDFEPDPLEELIRELMENLPTEDLPDPEDLVDREEHICEPIREEARERAEDLYDEATETDDGAEGEGADGEDGDGETDASGDGDAEGDDGEEGDAANGGNGDDADDDADDGGSIDTSLIEDLLDAHDPRDLKVVND